MQLDAIGQALEARAAEVQLVELFRACSPMSGIKRKKKGKRKEGEGREARRGKTKDTRKEKEKNKYSFLKEL